MSKIRNSSKGIILKDDYILLIKNVTSSDTWYTLPGGGQNFAESLHDALLREVSEETGITIVIEQLFAIREYIGKNHEFSEYDQDHHFVEYMFLCRALNEKIQITIPDLNQHDVDWVHISKLQDTNLYPKILLKILPDYFTRKILPKNIYLGDVN